MRVKKPVNIRVGKNIQLARERSGYTQEGLAELLGLSPNHLSAIERGVSGASFEMLEKLCPLCGVSADELLFGWREPGNLQERNVKQVRQIDEQYQPQVQKLLSAVLELIAKQ